MKTDEIHLGNLLPEAREMVGRSNEERIAYIEADRWIAYPKANFILGRMEKLMRAPCKDRMPNLLICGDSNNGKTSVVKKFCRNHPPTDGLLGDAYPVVYVQAPPVPDERRFYDEILSELMVPFRHRDAPSEKRDEIKYYFEKIGTRMLIVDEIHNILSGSMIKQRAFMNALKTLGNKMMIPIILVGTKDALMATNTDMQIGSRFKPIMLSLWKFDRGFVQLLASIEQTLPLKKASNLASKELAPEIHRLSEGQIGEIVSVISEAAEMAINTGSERITMKEIKACDFVLPSQRRGLAEMGVV